MGRFCGRPSGPHAWLTTTNAQPCSRSCTRGRCCSKQHSHLDTCLTGKVRSWILPAMYSRRHGRQKECLHAAAQAGGGRWDGSAVRTAADVSSRRATSNSWHLEGTQMTAKAAHQRCA